MIDKLDIDILDHILDSIIESGSNLNYRQFGKHDYFKNLDDEKQKHEFQRLIDYFEKYNCARIRQHGYFNSLEKNQISQRFKDKGGFNGVYQEELNKIKKEEEKEKLETNLAKSNIDANTLNIENASKNKWFTLINIAIGVLNLVLLAIQILTD